MKANRLRAILFAAPALALLLVLIWFWPASEPEHQGKPVSVWFKEYAFKTNALGPTALMISSQPGRIVTVQTMPGGRPTMVISPATNRQAQQVWVQSLLSAKPEPDPAWDALKALGSNAVPYLVRQLAVSRLEPAYWRVFTNLPGAVRNKLPNPGERSWKRYRAIDALAALGKPARAASPALLGLLEEKDSMLRSKAANALQRLGVDHSSLNEVLLRLGAERRYDEVLSLAFQLGWEGREVARLLGSLLQSSDAQLRIRAITLLERAGREASAAWDQIMAALKDPEEEVRYLAARSLEKIGTDAPQMIAALRASLTDSNVMVSNVTRRILKKIEPQKVESPAL